MPYIASSEYVKEEQSNRTEMEKKLMRNQYSIMQAYAPLLVERAAEYQAAQADGELLRTWVGTALRWVGGRLVAWSEGLQSDQARTHWQNPPQAR
jgi:hypothetical protein